MKFVPSPQSLRFLRSVVRTQNQPTTTLRACHPFLRPACRQFHATPQLDRTETHILSDIGEGVKEVQVIQWFVEEGAQIEEWSPLCEVQSDKAAVEISSKFTGVIKKIHFGRDSIVQVGDPMVDIEVEGEAEEEPAEENESEEGQNEEAESEQVAEEGQSAAEEEPKAETPPKPQPSQPKSESEPQPETESEPSKSHTSLATPAVRGLLKENKLAIEDIHGTGKDGRVLKEDVLKHLETRDEATSTQPPSSSKPQIDSKQTETLQKLTPIQSAMFKSMTASLSIPHFLYSDTINITNLAAMRTKLNEARNPETTPKSSFLPFIVKAVSLALNKYPILNARLDTSADPKRPQLQLRSNHNIGIAMDTPAGLVVPVIKSVNARSIASISEELQRLSQLGKNGKLSNADLTGGTITVSNIGNIGGEVLAPVIVEGQLAIMGIGKMKTVPVFGKDGQIEKAEMVNLSWSADHRVVDGATMARMARVVQGYLEEPGTMVIDMS